MINYISKQTSDNSYQLPMCAHVVSNTSIVLDVLLAGQGITVRDAVYTLDIFYLSQIVSRLRHHRNIKVKTKIHKVTNLKGKFKRYAEYYLDASDIAAFNAKSFH